MPSNVMVCIPSFDSRVISACYESVGNAIDYAESMGMLERVVHRYPRGYSIPRARNFMAQWALDEGCDHLWMVDSDMQVPKDALYNLLSNDVEVCTGFYVRGTNDDRMTNAIRKGAPTFNEKNSIHKDDIKGTGLLEVKGNGLGCALINTDVFRRFKRPWFAYLDFANGNGFAEDYYFCQQCAQNRVKVWVDTRVDCGHIKERVLR